jgi:4-amino-4-deoxy-L-arabinose transferase-like glycosyltransferase
VAAREIVASPNFYRSRIRGGLIAAVVGFAVAALGFVLRSVLGSREDGLDATLVIAIGLVVAGGGLVLALLAKLLDNKQRAKR